MRPSTFLLCVALLAAVCVTPSNLVSWRGKRELITLTVENYVTGKSTPFKCNKNSETIKIQKMFCLQENISFTDCKELTLYPDLDGECTLPIILRDDILPNYIKEGAKLCIDLKDDSS